VNDNTISDETKRRIVMDKKSSDKKSWLLTPAFYGVVFSLVIAIAGVGTAVYNVSKNKSIIPDSGKTIQYTVPRATETTTDYQANANATGIPDERETTSKTTYNDLNRPYSGYYLLPLNSKVSRDFSADPVYSETLRDWRSHNGIDVSGNIGDDAIAIQDGTVKEIYTDELWGDVIVIEHGNGMTAKYCGIKANVEKGAKVELGQVIGSVVMIPVESSDGAHVHLETEIGGKTVDPVEAMNLYNESSSIAE